MHRKQKVGLSLLLNVHFISKKYSTRFLTVADPDLQIRGGGGEGGDSHPDPEIRRGGGRKTKFCQPLGLQFGLKIRGGGGSFLDPPLS